MEDIQHDNWTKIETFSLFGKPFFTKETICRNQSYKGELIQITPPSKYYDSEFELGEKKKND